MTLSGYDSDHVAGINHGPQRAGGARLHAEFLKDMDDALLRRASTGVENDGKAVCSPGFSRSASTPFNNTRAGSAWPTALAEAQRLRYAHAVPFANLDP